MQMPDVAMVILEILVDHAVHADGLIFFAIEEIGRTIAPGLHAATMCGNAKVTPSDHLAFYSLGGGDGRGGDPSIFSEVQDAWLWRADFYFGVLAQRYPLRPCRA